MKVWVTRDGNGVDIWYSRDKPAYHLSEDCFAGRALHECFPDPYEFKKVFGFTPRKGSCKQYELSLKEIK